MERTSDSTSSTEDASGRATRVALGRVAGAHGLDGQVRVRYFGGDPDNLIDARAVMLAADEAADSVETFEIAAVGSGRRGEVRLALVGVEDRDAAEALRGQLVLVDADRLAPLADGEYYDYQLIGCRVYAADDGRLVGSVREVWSTGAPDVLVVEGASGEHLVPAAAELLREIDVEDRRIVVEIPPGLLDPAGGSERKGEGGKRRAGSKQRDVRKGRTGES